MTTIRLLVLDIDGTIAGESNQVSETVKQAIQEVQNQGIAVALATGRMYCSAKRFHQSINSSLPIIAYNGALIQNPQNDQIYAHIPVPKSLAQELLDYYDSYSEVEVHFYLEDQLYVQEITDNTKTYVTRSGVEANPVSNLRNLLDRDPTKVLALSPDPNLTQQLAQELQQRYSNEELYITQSNPIYLEATHASVNKGSAVKYLTEKILGLKPEQVMAIGDNFNDLTMLNYAGLSVAMGNAPEEVKDYADWVAPRVEEDGVAEAIKQLLMSKGMGSQNSELRTQNSELVN
jgi:Cof subfamily protein (haloacid dehalogenase superfamily)